MDVNHHNELIALSQEIYNMASDKLTNYCAAKYCAVGNETMEQQLEDYLFVAEEVSAYFLGNALALLAPESQEAEISEFSNSLRRVIARVQEHIDRNMQ